ncbi:hypothetical protein ACOM2C_13605 [Pseudarthrobacter sp. So.54]
MPRTRTVPGTSTVITRILLQVVAQQVGAEGVDRVLERAGLRDQEQQLGSVGGRIPYPDKLRLFQCAADELADPRIGLRLGPVLLRDPAIEPWRRLGRSTGSPAAAFRGISRIATHFDSASVFSCDWAAEYSASFTWKVLPPFKPNRIDCDYNVGFLAQMTVLFGLPPARVEHAGSCQLSGAPECVYYVTWTAGPLKRLRLLAGRLKRGEGRLTGA